MAEQKPADSVTILTADNDSVTLFLDNHTHLPIKKTFEWRDPADRLKNVEEEIFDNWRLEQGIMTPHSVLRSHNGDITNQRFVTNVRYNVGLPDSLFQTTITYDPNKKPTKAGGRRAPGFGFRHFRSSSDAQPNAGTWFRSDAGPGSRR